MEVRYKVNGKDVAPEEFSAGEGDKLREMLETGSPPMSNTDREFLEGHTDNSTQATLGQFAEPFKAQALAAGVNPKGKVYLGGLATFPGDPKAWVGGRADVARVCEEQNFGCEGAVTAKTNTSRIEG